VDKVADATVQCLLRAVPAAVPGIAFLSGGQPGELASARLNANNVRFKSRLPWPLSFSFARVIRQTRRATFWRHRKPCIIEPAAIGLRAMAITMPRWRGHEHDNKDFQTHAICGIATVRTPPGAGQPEAFGSETGSKPEVDDILKRRAQPGVEWSANRDPSEQTPAALLHSHGETEWSLSGQHRAARTFR
jgi:hypothetical protein